MPNKLEKWRKNGRILREIKPYTEAAHFGKICYVAIFYVIKIPSARNKMPYGQKIHYYAICYGKIFLYCSDLLHLIRTNLLFGPIKESKEMGSFFL